MGKLGKTKACRALLMRHPLEELESGLDPSQQLTEEAGLLHG